MKPQHRVWVAGLFVLSVLGGCAPELGTLDKTDPSIDEALGVGVPEPPVNPPPVPPDPFQPGDERLSVGYFYEGGWSEEIPINRVTTNYFIFIFDENRPPFDTLTYDQIDVTDRIEGLISVEITLRDFPFWGGGILWDEPTDLSEWTTLNVAFKSSDPSFARFDLTLQYEVGRRPDQPPPDPLGVALDPTTYGYTNDGQWHFLQIPLQDAIDRGWDPSNARSPFIIGASGGERGDIMLIDNLYFTKD